MEMVIFKAKGIRSRRIVGMPILFFLLVYHFFLSTYLYVVKRVRKSVLLSGG